MESRGRKRDSTIINYLYTRTNVTGLILVDTLTDHAKQKLQSFRRTKIVDSTHRRLTGEEGEGEGQVVENGPIDIVRGFTKVPEAERRRGGVRSVMTILLERLFVQ